MPSISVNGNKAHFETFDALRFLSFFLVFLHHALIPSTSFLQLFTKSGGIGVIFFFVLSGFLITYILLHEKLNNGKISLKHFFIRRILRIWPLYYAMIFFAFLTPFLLDVFQLTSANEGYEPNWIMSLLFLENYQMIITESFPNVSPLRVMWTLCIEEHFYIIWGILLSVISIKRIPLMILISLVFANIIRPVYSFMGVSHSDIFTNIDYFAFGAIPAYIFILKPHYLLKVEQLSLWVKYLVGLISISLLFGMPYLNLVYKDFISPLLFGSFFSLLILFTLPQTNRFYISDKSWLSKLGVYTYGLYLFHTIVLNFINQLNMGFLEDFWIIQFILALFLTISLSYLSYHYFEKQFLKLKTQFHQ